MEMIEVGLIGYGLAGRAFHAPVIRAVPRMHLAAIFERTGNEAAEKYPDVRTVRSLDELLGIREIRLVVIATPNDTHYSLARQCLAAGRDVVVDKPFTTTLDEARSLVELAEKAGRLITVYQNRRYEDRKSTRLNSSHVAISYAVFCLKKKKKNNKRHSRQMQLRHRNPPSRSHSSLRQRRAYNLHSRVTHSLHSPLRLCPLGHSVAAER